MSQLSDKKVRNETNQSFQHPIGQEHNTRTLAYLTFAAPMMVGITSGFLADIFIALVIFQVVYPTVVRFFSEPVRRRFPAPTKALLSLIDATVFGASLTALGLSPLLSLLLLIMAHASFISAGSLVIYAFSLVFFFIGAGSFYYYFPPALDAVPPTEMMIVSALFVGFYVWVTAYYLHKQAESLRQIHADLEKQSTAHRELSQKLSRYISPQVWKTIFSGEKDAKLETSRKKLVVFFSDIKGFTSLSEELQPESLTDMLNHYLNEMSKIALKHGGTIDKFIGDSVMVFFGDPESMGHKEDAIACVTMAIDMRHKMSQLALQWRKMGINQKLEVRMGINTGYCTVGNFGATERMDYTIVGKEVNLASRLESSAQANEILISHETYELVKEKILCRERGQIQAKGFSKPVRVYEAMGLRKDMGSKQTFNEYEFDGFVLQVDLEKVHNYDKDKILAALAKSHERIKKTISH